MAPPPSFADIAKPSNDLLNKDFYHSTSRIVEVKLKSPDGPTVTAKITEPHEGETSAYVEAKKVIQKGINATGTCTTANNFTTKLELDDILAVGVKAEYLSVFSPKTGFNSQKGNIFFKHGPIHARSFFEYTPATGNVTALVDGVVSHEGFLVGGEAGFDVQKAALTRYAAAFGYQTPIYAMALQANKNLSVVTAGYHHRLSDIVEAGARASYDTKTKATTGLEVAVKYKIDPTAFAKVKLTNRGVLSLAYNTKVNSLVTVGIGASIDTGKINVSSPFHKIGGTLTFEG